MHYRSESSSVANHFNRTRCGQPVLLRAPATAIVAALALFVGRAGAQEPLPPAVESAGLDAGAPPISQSGSGDLAYFSQDLGTILRLRYNTNSYGQDGTGNFDIGTMQVVTMDDTAAFFDGQVTMNESDGVGFNIGVGYRWLNFPMYAAGSGRMDGISLWADGTHTDAGNFFPQVGVSYESLGELWDVRANGYIPVGDNEQVGAFRATNQVGFEGNSISNITKATVDRSFYSAELEVARRLGAQRDAWGFAGPYFVANDAEDSAGFRAGMRGYAYPDLLLQFAVSDDDVFKTNATFSVIWFVGRTRTDFQPACGTPDRFREPVMRNDYVVLSHKNRFGGNALTNPDGTALRVVHVDSNAAPGGNGTAENPFDMLTDVNNTGSQAGDIILAHSTSVFTGESSVILKDDQRLLGEGNNLVHTVATLQRGTIDIPESSPGARALARPQINGFTGDAITLANDNEVSNFDIDGQNVTARAIAAPAGGAGNPNLNHLAITNTTGNGIDLASVTVTDPNDATKQIVENNATIDTVTFDNIGGDDIKINSATATDVTNPNNTLQETIAVSNVTSTNGGGAGVRLIDTHSAGTASIMNYTNGNATAGSGGGLAGEGVLRFEGSAADKFAGDLAISNADIQNNLGFAFDFLNVASTTAVTLGTGSSWDGGAGVAGGFRANNFNGTVNASNTTLTGGTLGGVQLLNASAGTFTFQNTFTMTNIGGTDFDVNGGAGDLFTGTVSYASDISNNNGRSVSIQGVSDGSVTLNGDITDTAQGILVNSNSGGLMLFAGDLNMDTTTNTAVTITDNTGADIDFPGKVDIVTTTGDGFVATGGGTLTMSAANNTITTNTGQILKITDMTISNSNVRVADVNRTAGAATNAIQLENNTGGSIDIGMVTDTAGLAGTIAGGTADAILIRNSANVSVNGVTVNNTSAVAGVRVDKSNTNVMTVSLGDLDLNDGSHGLQVTGNGTTGNLNMTINQTAINRATTAGMSFDNVDAGTITVTAANIDGNNVGPTGKGVLITNSNATFNFDSATQIHEWNDNDFEVNGGTGSITFAGSIVNNSTANAGDTTGHSVEIHNMTGGSVSFTAASSIDDNNQGMRIENNGGTATTAAAISFLGTNMFNMSGSNTAITVDNNDLNGKNAVITLGGLNITGTDTARGLIASNGGTISVAGTTNVINTDDGTALSLTDMTIGAVDFQTVTADGATGPANAIVLTNLTGGQVAIGASGGAQNSGGVLRTTVDAILVSNVENVDLRHIQIVGAGGQGVNIDHTAAGTTAMDVTIQDLNLDASTGSGMDVLAANNAHAFNLRLNDSDLERNVVMSNTGSGAFGLLVDGNDITTTTGADIAFALSFSGSAQTGNVTIRNDNNFAAANASALSIATSGATFKTINLLVDGGDFMNSSASPAATFTSGGNTQLNATIQSNIFTNGTGSDFLMTASGAQGRILLNLGGDTAADFNTAAGTGNFDLDNSTGGTFNVFEKTDTFANLRNNGTVVPTPNAAAFGDSAVPPTLPTVP